MSDLQIFADFAEEVADAGRAAALRWSESEWDVMNKRDEGPFDPVTRADRESELAMRALIEERWKDHGIEGEEFGRKAGAGPYCWSLDPIDGTRSFISGLPTWTILVALLEEGRPLVGVIDAPRLGERYIGHGANGLLITSSSRSRLATSRCRSLSEARLSTTDPYLFSAQEREGFDRIRRSARLTRYGLDGYAYAKVASGGLDLVVESGLAPHDLNALVPVVTAAGGAVSNWRGEADLSKGNIIAAASAELLDEAVALLR
ncbi:MAG: histidinol-phosphatase [Sphingosinicella sp.]|nr:histidinol-phosphatase [Sphingosinicella sp.]